MAKSAHKKSPLKKTTRSKPIASPLRLAGLVKRYAMVVSYTLLTLSLSITLSWVILAKQDFLYGIWHDHGGIGAAIDKYGPVNRFKVGFGQTSRGERVRLFAEINQSVHRGGEGLSDIYYHTPVMPNPQRMLRQPEVVHLQDVANLIDVLFWIGFGSVICWLGVSGYLLLVKRSMPGAQEQSFAMLGVLVIAGVAVMLLGPNNVFSAFHRWVFPDGHQWFFYYQESLMSTLMYAPHLFGWIAGAMVGLAVMIFLALQVVLVFVARMLAR